MVANKQQKTPPQIQHKLCKPITGEHTICNLSMQTNMCTSQLINTKYKNTIKIITVCTQSAKWKTKLQQQPRRKSSTNKTTPSFPNIWTAKRTHVFYKTIITSTCKQCTKPKITLQQCNHATIHQRIKSPRHNLNDSISKCQTHIVNNNMIT